MFEIKIFDDWRTHEGVEGSGRSEKEWLISSDGKIGLFKYPKTDSTTGNETTEHISEHLAHQIGNHIGVSTAKVDIGTRCGRMGSMSYLVKDEKEILVEGINFICGRYPKFNVEKMKDEETGLYYCIEHIFNSVPNSILPNSTWIEMMIFDFLIGNRDRHQSNWAVLMSTSLDNGNLKFHVRKCPLYDNGSSLCSFVNESQVNGYNGTDKMRFNSLVDSKSRSMIRIDGAIKSLPTHLEVIKYLVKKYPSAQEISNRIVCELTEDIIETILNQYPEVILSNGKKCLIKRYLIKKVELLKEILNKED